MSNFSIKIDSAVYGSSSVAVDVTAAAQNALKGDDLKITAETFGIPDPDPGVLKHCGIIATVTNGSQKPQQVVRMAHDFDVVDFFA